MSEVINVKAEYSVKKLYEASTGTSIDSSTHESLWGYSVSYLNEVKVGRFRIRITKMSANDFIAAFGKSENDMSDDYSADQISGYSISGYLEKWHPDGGWMQCLDWLGEPDSSNEQIEQDLLDMFRAFVTGMPTSEVSKATSPWSPKPAGKKSFSFNKYVKKNDYDSKPTKSKDKPAKPKKDDDDPDFDWI